MAHFLFGNRDTRKDILRLVQGFLSDLWYLCDHHSMQLCEDEKWKVPVEWNSR